MCNGERYIKTLAIVTIIFSVCKVLVSIESITLSELRDSIVPLSRNLSFFLLIIYAVYKRKNVARLILSGIATLGLISCVLLLFQNGATLDVVMTAIFGVICLLILSNSDVIDYVMKSDKPV